MISLINNYDIYFVAVAVASTAVLGFTIYLSNKNNLTSKLFFLFSIVTALWGITNLFGYRVEDPRIGLYIARMVMFFASWQAFSMFLLFYAFPLEEKRFSKFVLYGILPLVSIVSIISITPLVLRAVRDVTPDNRILTLENGPAIPIFGLVSVGLVVVGLFILLVKIFRSSKANRRPLYEILIGTFLTFVLIIPFNFILPAVFSDSRFVPLGALFILPFVFFTSYAILREKLFDVKVAGPAILVFFLAIVTFSEVIFAKEISLVISRGIIFVLVLVFGILLIKNVLKEIQQREEIQKLSSNLEKTNMRLQKLDKTKSEFLSIASHQLRTPISGIKGYLSMILEGDFGKVEDKPKEILQSIYDNTERLNGLVNDFLDVSRIERGKLTMERKPTDISEMIQSIVANFQPVADAKGIILDYSPSKSAIPPVDVDPNKLRQVAMNLVDNAIKYTHQGSIHVTLDGEKDRFRVCVKDTGIGLDPDEAKNLFRPFVRTADSSKSNATGSGLGLYVARKIVQYHGGKVWAESEGKGKGSTFCMEVPYDQSILPEPEPEPYLE